MERLLALLLILLYGREPAAAQHLNKRAEPTEPTEPPLFPTPSNTPNQDQATENPRVSLGLKISFGILAAIFSLSILFCAYRSSRRGRNEAKDVEVHPPDSGNDQAVEGLELRGVHDEEAEEVERPRLPEDAHVSQERVRSWVMELDHREVESPPAYEGHGGERYAVT
ncbi:hypothetical protein FN846DRAFT_890297 [Sphaerosporella brunnea]|uniref:Uncharacterized protein n=1 Tax=Sphaerosporella brunnea TaxID=1250544 RepID=A0A5J5EX46_9PEZI|nr:hypothetical protein FN846DRAFT_890297 [Sphaerosporella brunnea]